MKAIEGQNCPWLFCCCGTCTKRPRALRIRQDGIEWTPTEWVAAFG